ncbi:MAG: CocE/NonD family hydrolase [Ferruginibacter sp.]
MRKPTFFFTGENSWKKSTKWPPDNVEYKSLYIQAKGKLSFEKPVPAQTANRGKAAVFSEYTSDPSHPVPYTEDVHNQRTREYMTDDQRFAGRRPDVLSFQTDTLAEELTLAGPVIASLITAINTTDADFVVKLIDVFPDYFTYDSSLKGNGNVYPMGGYQMLVRGEIMRGKFRNSFETPAPFIPNKITPVKYELPDVAHTFKKGHRLMIQIQSSWFPLADRNPQKFINIYTANDSDFQKAVIRIYHDPVNMTQFILPVIKK